MMQRKVQEETVKVKWQAVARKQKAKKFPDKVKHSTKK